MKYMLIDTTTSEKTSVLAIAKLPAITLLGKIHRAQGKSVIAPPLEGRGFAKLETLALQYLYWNTCKEAPPEDYNHLVRQCLAKLNTLPEDQTPLEDLEREVARLYPESQLTPGSTSTGQVDAPSAPKATSTTGKVWMIADRLLATGSTDRKAVIAACVAEGINPATASTQYGKWRASKL